MTTFQLFMTIREKFIALDGLSELLASDEAIKIHALTTDAILGTAERKDFPILAGKEIIQQAEYGRGKGQSFTSQPVNCSFTLRELLELPLDNVRDQGAFVAGMNAVMHHLGLITNTVHCKDDGPECCSKTAAGTLRRKYGDVKLALIGYQPCLLANLSAVFPQMRVTDLGKDKIGTEKYGILVEDGTHKSEEVCEWADVILCTGSTLTNETILYFYELALHGREIMFYGTTIAGAAKLLDLRRLCYADSNGKPFTLLNTGLPIS